MNANDTQDQIISLLEETEREGMAGMINYLKEHGFFTSPASTRFHGCWRGGLADHSMNVQRLLLQYNQQFQLHVDEHSITIATLLHDLCKIGAYLGSGKPYKWNRSQPKGHALLSLIRIAHHITLTEVEDKMIQYHMGVYGLKEFDPESGKGEYTLRTKGMIHAWHHYPIVKVMYFCDEFATFEEKTKENN